MSFTINNNQIITSNRELVTFDYPIKEAVEINGIIVVLLGVPSNRVMTENVFAISTDGKMLWQIERTIGNSTDPVNVYTGFTGHDEHSIQVYNWNGTANVVDLETGKVRRTEIAR